MQQQGGCYWAERHFLFNGTILHHEKSHPSDRPVSTFYAKLAFTPFAITVFSHPPLPPTLHIPPSLPPTDIQTNIAFSSIPAANRNWEKVNLPSTKPSLAHCTRPAWLPTSHLMMATLPSMTCWSSGWLRKCCFCWPQTVRERKSAGQYWWSFDRVRWMDRDR